MSAVAALLLICGEAGATGELLKHRQAFAHNASTQIEELITEARSQNERVGVILCDGGGAWGGVYFPIRFRFGDAVPQYLLRQNGLAIQLLNLPSLTNADPALPGIQKCLLIATENTQASELVNDLNRSRAPQIISEVSLEAFEGLGWQPDSRAQYPAISSTDIAAMVRVVPH